MEWYLKVLKQYADFNGRARRKEYWMFTLINVLISLVLGVLDVLIFGIDGLGLFGIVYSLGIIIPSLAVNIRRLHDIGKSGWWLLVALIPLIGAILLLVWAATEGEPGTNEYGPNPKSGGFDDSSILDAGL